MWFCNLLSEKNWPCHIYFAGVCAVVQYLCITRVYIVVVCCGNAQYVWFVFVGGHFMTLIDILPSMFDWMRFDLSRVSMLIHRGLVMMLQSLLWEHEICLWLSVNEKHLKVNWNYCYQAWPWIDGNCILSACRNHMCSIFKGWVKMCDTVWLR